MIGNVIGFVLGVAAALTVWRLHDWRAMFGWRVRFRPKIVVGAGDCVAVEIYRRWRVSDQELGVIPITHPDYAERLDELLTIARLRAAHLNAATRRSRRRLPA